MQRVSNGYTIIEVLIFLAISAVLMTFSFNLINGKQAEAEFNQKMRDTRSQIQDWLNDVTAGHSAADTDNTQCHAGGNNPPKIDRGPGGGNNPECIFLGKAIQFTDSTMSPDQSEQIFAYSVFGRRLSAGSGDIPTSLTDSSPIAATKMGGSGDKDITEVFGLSPVRVKSVTANGPYANSHMLGFISSFNTEQSAAQNGNNDLNIFEYNFNGSTSAGNEAGGGAVRDCIQLIGGCNSPAKLTSYQICMTDGHRTAMITISSPVGIGATTSLDYVSC